MNIFVINCGSSSIKYQLFQMPSTSPVCTGLIERIGQENAYLKHKTFRNGTENSFEKTDYIQDHESGLMQAVLLLTHPENGVLKNGDEIDVVGHRIVHGGELYTKATVIDAAVKENIQKLFPLAPLHNPANFTGVLIAEKVFAKAKQIAVFDTAFHQTISAKAFRYAIPKKLYTEDGIRSYGFHGTSHKYVSEQAIQYLQNPAAKIISIHLGNGCSMAAIDAGKSIDTSMGFGPLSGLIMGTRSGDIDPSVIFHLLEKENYTAKEVATLLNKESGMLGMVGSNDMRDVAKAVAAGNEDAELASEMYTYRIQKYLGAYIAALKGLDAVLFTAGVGENDSSVRESVCSGLEIFNIHLDKEKNAVRSGILREINVEDASVKILVVPTNEELEIANQCYQLLQ